MNFEDIKNKFLKLINSDHSNKTKIYLTISHYWIIFIG